MRHALPAAIANSELFALYQPLISAGGGKAVAAEALLRWDRPGLGIVEPDAFIPYAEENGLIVPVGNFMLQLACRDASQWPELRIAVNVSPSQFGDPDFAALIVDIAQSADLPLHRLELEVTESTIFPQRAMARSQMEALRARGVTLALDDLGSGYSTAELMTELPLDRVKLSRELIKTFNTADGAQQIRQLVSSARARGLGVTGEGVETQDEYSFLRDLGCDVMQGFLFAEPMSAEGLTDFLRAQG